MKRAPNDRIVQYLEALVVKAKSGDITNLVVLFDQGEDSRIFFELTNDSAIIKFIGLVEVTKSKISDLIV